MVVVVIIVLVVMVVVMELRHCTAPSFPEQFMST